MRRWVVLLAVASACSKVLRRARVVVDSREAAMKESGDVIAGGHIEAELGEVLTGVKNGRTAAGEITLFKSLGMAVEEVVTAKLVYDHATRS